MASPEFPPASAAPPEGLLLLGGELSPEWLLTAYRGGIFPWPVVEDDWEVLAWFSPDPRAIIELDQLHISRRLARRLRSGKFHITSDHCFGAVMAGCAAPRKSGTGTWITKNLVKGYGQLHRLGHAHSIEVWEGERLVGGLYGVSIGGYFSAESMFHRVRDASKVALVSLVAHLRQRGYRLLDIQQSTPHATSMGASEIRRDVFLRRLGEAIELPVSFGRITPDEKGSVAKNE